MRNHRAPRYPRAPFAPAPPLAAILAALAGCAGSGQRSSEPLIPTRIQPVVLDGDVGEWAPGLVATADPWWIYMRWKVAGEAHTLQSDSENLSIWPDTDTNPSTGERPSTPPRAAQLGVDLQIEFSPPKADGAGLDRGVRVTKIADGQRRTISHGDVGFSFAPTYASEWYEGRISRQRASDLGLPGLDRPGIVTGLLVLRDSTGRILGSSEPFEVNTTAASQTPPLADLRLPRKPEGGLRVVSWNVLKGKPMEDPGPFARVLHVLDPDVILFQEWTSPASEIAAWLNASLPLDGSPWEVRTTTAWGVAVASRFPIEPFGHEELYLDGAEDPIRFAGALIDTPAGHLAAASIHLKCCGSSGSPEDEQRISEAGAINRSLTEALAIEPVPMRIIAGDFNLVGSRPPLDVMRNGLDADGSDLEIMDARDLGDAAYMTWQDDPNAFSPGRLDYALVGEGGAKVVRAFVLNARILSDRALDAAGLDRADAEASDHMPIVVDLRPK
ncbi:MAG: endonuclease/exonuclease/phosphatase family protein [Phycisphaerales bacterium]|nr:endonuclease/exonuclease/phosphatase family protein [Phycisphaerales bacterium]